MSAARPEGAGAERQGELFVEPDEAARGWPDSRIIMVYVAPSARLVGLPDNDFNRRAFPPSVGGMAGARMEREFGLKCVLGDYNALPDVRKEGS